MLNETELAEIKCLTLSGENVVITAVHFDALLSSVREQRELINEQRSTIIALMTGVEEHTGKEGTTPVLRYIEELQRRETVEWTDDDKPLPEDEQIDAAFPTRTGRHDLYAEAMRMVGAKRSKGALVALVNWLLSRALSPTPDVSTPVKLIDRDQAIIATSVEADFEKGTWTFEPKGKWSVRAGDYYLIPVKP